jgi:hypothetical protein
MESALSFTERGINVPLLAAQGKVPGSLLNNPWGMTLRDVLRKVDKVDRKQMFPPCSHKNRHSGNEEYLVKLNT